MGETNATDLLASTAPTSASNAVPGLAVTYSALKHYEIIRKLGQGGMGAVYLARDTKLGRLVAVKVVLDPSAKSAERFLAEARSTARCKHENIVGIHDVDEASGVPYMVLEHLEGQTLRALLTQRGGPLPPRLAVELMLPVVRALGCAHALGIVHRDLKPENVFLTEAGAIKVLDFGIAKQLGSGEVERRADTGRALASEATRVTGTGVAVGTPLYMAPEQLRAETIDARADLWAVGVMLFELATGTHPLTSLSAAQIVEVETVEVPMPRAIDRHPDVGPLGDAIDRCLQKRPEERFASAEDLAEALELLLVDEAPSSQSDGSPFAGLSAFQEADSARFFGRERDVAAVVGRLRNQSLLVVTGPSGAGKSSFVRAGVIPASKRAGRVEARVIRPGRRPLAALAEVITSFEGPASKDPASMVETLVSQPGYLGARLRARCKEKGNGHRVLLFVDQFEELYTQQSDAGAREAFCAALSGAADDASSPLRVIVAMRADFLERLAEDRGFLSEVMRGLYFLPPITAEGLRDALTRPAEAAGYAFEDGALVDEILGGIAGMKSPLPILQFTATKLWSARDPASRRLTREAYLGLGGVAGALSAHADAVLAAMPPAEQRITRAVLLRLVTPERTRALVALDELGALSEDQAAASHAVQRLAEARLVAIESGAEGEGASVELAHESLIERWGKLRGWLDEAQQDAQFLAELRSASAQWEKNGRSPGFLWRDEAARRAELWLAGRKTAAADEDRIGARQRAYLDALTRHAAAKRRRQRGLVAAAFAVTVVIAVVIGALALRSRTQAARADDQARKAGEQAVRADQQARHAEDEARQARNATRMAAAREVQSDPTTALALLREIEPGSVPQGWGPLSLAARGAGVAERVLSQAAIPASIAWSPDGDRLVSASWDGTVRVERVDGTGTPLILAGHTSTVEAAAFSHDGRRIVSSSRDATVRVWNADGTGTPLILRGHVGSVDSTSFSPDDRYIVSAGDDKTLRIWNADGTGSPLVLRGHDRTIISVAWSPDGARVVSGSSDRTVRVWNADGRGTPLVLRGHEDRVWSVAWSPDGRRVVSGAGDKTVRVWNVDGTGTSLVLRGHEGRVASVEFSPDGTRIVSSSTDATARVWAADGASPPVVLRGHSGPMNSAMFSPDGLRIASAAEDKTVRVWNVAQRGQTLTLCGHEREVNSAEFSPDGRRIVSASFDKTVRVWNADGTGTPLVLLGHESPVLAVCYSPDGKRLASASEDRTVRVWNADGTGAPLVVRGHRGPLTNVTFSPDGRQLASTSGDGTVRVWNADGTGEPSVLTHHHNVVMSAAWSPDGARMLSASVDKTLRVWNVDGSGEPVWRTHPDMVSSAGFSPDGARIAAGSADKMVYVWSTNSDVPLVLRGHTEITLVRGQRPFSPDGRRLVSSSNDGTVRIWNADGSGEPIVLRGSGAPINSASWSPDGKRIVAASDDKTVILFDDLEPISGPDDPRLWTATRYCIPLDIRGRLLGFTETQSRADLARCQRHMDESAGPQR